MPKETHRMTRPAATAQPVDCQLCGCTFWGVPDAQPHLWLQNPAAAPCAPCYASHAAMMSRWNPVSK